MGRLGLTDMLNWADAERALVWHLQSNHYPPVSLDFIPACRAAIEAAREEDYDREITCPDWARRKTMTAAQLMDGLHLWPFVETEDEDEEEAEA